MPIVKTSELTGPALDWAVARCEGKNGVFHDDGITRCVVIAAPSGIYNGTWTPSINWSQAGPIIEREGVSVEFGRAEFKTEWIAYKLGTPHEDNPEGGHAPLVAAMRCYVASKLGDSVEIPDELI